MNKKRVLFYGELPPSSVHGIAISNRINLNILRSSFGIDIIEEKTRLSKHDKFSVTKLVNFVVNNFRIFFKSAFNSYEYFYLIFSLTTFGSIKTLFAILNFRIFDKGKVVLHIHRGDFFTRFYKKTVNKLITKLVFGLSHKIIVLSDKQVIEFNAYFKKPCYSLCNTAEIELNDKFRMKQNISFIYISNYLIDKGILDLLEVFRRIIEKHQSVTLNTYGSFSDSKLKETILDYSCSNICIYEAIYGMDKFNKIAEADCLILPSWNEGQPTILLEAMSVGTPLISTDVGLIPDLLGEDYLYLAKPRDKKSLELKILQFIKNQDSDNISKKLLSRYYQFYSQKRHAEQLYKIFS